MKRDYYEILGVNKTATADRLKKATAKWPCSFTPTIIPAIKPPKKNLKEAAEAYEVLSDADKRG